MKAIEIPFGKGIQTIHVAEDRLQAVLTPQHEKLSQDTETQIVEKALENPIGSSRLCEICKDKKKILLITSDHTRPVPSKVTMPPFLREIRKGNPDAEITILIATGMHRPTTEAELRAKMGDEIVDR